MFLYLYNVYIDKRREAGQFMLLEAKWMFLLLGNLCIQIMGGLINLHTKHPLMTKSDVAWAKAMHTCTGRRIKISKHRIRQLFSWSSCLFLIFPNSFWNQCSSRDRQGGENYGHFSGADLWVGAPRNDHWGRQTDKFLFSSLDRFPRWKFQPGGSI